MAKFQIMEPLSEKEYESLKQSIEQDGVQIPIEKDGEGNILDGHHRVEICEKLGIDDYPVNIKTGFESEEEKKTYIRKINLARRHLNQNQREKLIKGQLKDTPEKSNNRIAKMLGVSPHTVIKYRKELEESLQIANFSKLEDPRTGELSQPAEKPKTIPTRNKKDEEKAQKIIEKVEEGNETAQKELNKITKGKRTVNNGYKKIGHEEEKQELKEKVKELEPPEGKYNVIVIDPPWPYGTRYDPDNRRVGSPYPEMSIDELREIELPAADNCILWLWTTNAFIHEAYHLLKNWEFEPKTILTWVKDRMGVGHWLRGQTEHCILATAGDPEINLTNETTVLNAKNEGHSVKPDEFYDMVDSLCRGKKLDYFSRREREGWSTYGTGEDVS